MKKILLSVLFVSSFLMAADAKSVAAQGCIENLEKDVIEIVNSGVQGNDRQKAIDVLKIKIEKDYQNNCEKDFENQIKNIVNNDKNTTIYNKPVNAPVKMANKSKPTDIDSENCIDNFEAEVLKIINSNPTNADKEETKKIMQEIMRKKIEANCESEFEKETKNKVYSEDKK